MDQSPLSEPVSTSSPNQSMDDQNDPLAVARRRRPAGAPAGALNRSMDDQEMNIGALRRRSLRIPEESGLVKLGGSADLGGQRLEEERATLEESGIRWDPKTNKYEPIPGPSIDRPLDLNEEMKLLLERVDMNEKRIRILNIENQELKNTMKDIRRGQITDAAAFDRIQGISNLVARLQNLAPLLAQCIAGNIDEHYLTNRGMALTREGRSNALARLQNFEGVEKDFLGCGCGCCPACGRSQRGCCTIL